MGKSKWYRLRKSLVVVFMACCLLVACGKEKGESNYDTNESTKISQEEILERAKELSGAPCAEVDSVTDDGQLVIHLYEDLEDHTSTYDWYTINPDTLIGENLMGEEVDLNSIGEK